LATREATTVRSQGTATREQPWKQQRPSTTKINKKNKPLYLQSRDKAERIRKQLIYPPLLLSTQFWIVLLTAERAEIRPLFYFGLLKKSRASSSRNLICIMNPRWKEV